MGKSYRELAAQGQAELDADYHDEWAAAIAWAVQQLPDEHPPLVAAAYLTTRLNGKPSADAIRKRLAHQGRDVATLRARTEGARK